MPTEFSHIITLLRKENNITQKQASLELGISQALLSHYEKGIRECGLSFVIKIADYYGVSCDYLLGRSQDRSGLSADEMFKNASNTNSSNSALPSINKNLITNSLYILYDKMGTCSNKTLVNEISAYLMLALYKVFRLLYEANPNNQSMLFSISPNIWDSFTSASLSLSEANIKATLKTGFTAPDQVPYLTPEDIDLFAMSAARLEEEYPQLVDSFLSLIKSCEKRINALANPDTTVEQLQINLN